MCYNNVMIYTVMFIILIGPLIGAGIGVFRKYTKKQVYMMLAFAAGVMISISILQLLPSSLVLGNIGTVLAGFLIGCLLMWLLNFVIPHFHHADHESKLKRAAFFLFVGIFIHNFPEGLAIGAGGLQGLHYSLLVALAIAIHDIPETVCISAPLSRTLKNRHKAFWLAIFSAVPTIIGYILSRYIFSTLPSSTFALIISATAGIMIYVSIVEILRPIYQVKINKYVINLCVVCGGLLVLLLQMLSR